MKYLIFYSYAVLRIHTSDSGFRIRIGILIADPDPGGQNDPQK
jgi:hypothetical protein